MKRNDGSGNWEYNKVYYAGTVCKCESKEVIWKARESRGQISHEKFMSLMKVARLVSAPVWRRLLGGTLIIEEGGAAPMPMLVERITGF